MKVYLSEADVEVIIRGLRCIVNVPGSSELLAKLHQIKAGKGKAPIVGAINVTGTITEFAEVTHLPSSSYLASYLTKLTRFPLLGNNELRLFVDNGAMLDTLRKAGASYGVMEAAQTLKRFPAPNPDLLDNKNALGQTEEEFWAATEAMMERA
jgi:hypothetical protein